MTLRSRYLLLYCAAIIDENESNESFNERLTQEGRMRRQRRYPRYALQHPHYSALATMFGSGCDQSLITACGLDHRAFRELRNLIHPVYEQYSPYTENGYLRRTGQGHAGGRRRSMDSTICLALYLMWHRSRGSITFLSLIFGVTNSVCSLFIRFARRIIISLLSKDARAMVKMPNNDEIMRFKAVFKARHQSLSDVYCVVDGLKLKLQ